MSQNFIPENPSIGQKWYDPSVQPTGQMKIWNGTAWVEAEFKQGFGPGSTAVEKQ
jgi:hypothetical protein